MNRKYNIQMRQLKVKVKVISINLLKWKQSRRKKKGQIQSQRNNTVRPKNKYQVSTKIIMLSRTKVNGILNNK